MSIEPILDCELYDGHVVPDDIQPGRDIYWRTVSGCTARPMPRFGVLVGYVADGKALVLTDDKHPKLIRIGPEPDSRFDLPTGWHYHKEEV